MTLRVLVTGANGLIGGKVVELLRAEVGYEPIALVRNKMSLATGTETIIADLADANFVSRLPSKIDAVIHLAQAEGYAVFPDQARAVFQVNLAAFVGLLDWAGKAGVKHFVHASTGGLYGRGRQPFRETDPIHLDGPLAFYFGTKRAAELLAEPYGKLFGVTALRFFFVYGLGQNGKMLIPRLANAVQTGRPVMLEGPDGMRINPVHVDDAASAAVRALRLEGHAVLNVGGPEALSIRDISRIIGETLGKPPVFEQSGGPEGNDVVGDISLMQGLLHQPKVGFRDGVSYLKHAAP
jgi:UDP-glucose 4-epimerase